MAFSAFYVLQVCYERTCYTILQKPFCFLSDDSAPYSPSGMFILYPTIVYVSSPVFPYALFYDIIFMLSTRYPATGGGVVYMEYLAISFLISCLASIAAYYVCKWLDGDK